MTPYSIPPLLTLCCLLGFAGLTVLRGRKTKVNILFLLICILGSFLYADILIAFNVKSPETALRISRIDHFFIIYLFPLYIHFFHTYLKITNRKWILRLAYAYAFFLMWFTPTALYIESMEKHFFGFFAKGGKLYPFFGIAGLFVTIYALVILYQAIQKESSNVHKNRLKYIFVGFGVTGLMNGLNVFPILGYSMYPPGNLSFIPFIVFAVGVYKHDLLDMGILIKKSLIYSVLTALLTGSYAFIITLANKVFGEFNFSESFYFPVFFFFLIAFVFGPLKTNVQAFVDRIFYKGKYDYQKTIKNVSQMIVSVLDLDEIGKRLTETVADTMRVDNCTLFLSNETGREYVNFSARGKDNYPRHSTTVDRKAALINFMEKQPRPVIKKNLLQSIADTQIQEVLAGMEKLNAEIALPMIFKEQLKGVIILGEKLSGDLFSPEDLDLLETLSSQGALAIENARSYQRIEDLNKNLEKKVVERTKALNATLIEKERAQEMLIRSESLAALGQLVAGVAHELNNPLASLTSLIQTAIEDLEQWDKELAPDENLIDDLKFADGELARAKSIVASLLDLSRQTQTYSETVDLNLVIQDALRVLYNQHKNHHIDFVQNYAQDLPDIRGNFANLGQVAVNIIKNAIQAIADEKGTIILTTRYDKETGQVVFTCKDTGPGIPELLRQDIFKPFFTTKDVGFGTGLGLYICHEIIAKHGGTLTLESATEQGSQFEVQLPTIHPPHT
jgi:two-component system NtrC family sensor kinase